MDVFDLRDRLVGDYASYTRSFIKIADQRISETVDSELNAGALWPEPLLQLNPTFLPGGSIDDLVSEGILHSECSKIFRIDKTASDLTGSPLILHTHQREAILKAKDEVSYVLTSGTGSGKSLAYIVPIVDHVLRKGSGNGIQAIVVYPMNALANSQNEELQKFLKAGYGEGGGPVTFARYTGQESSEERESIKSNPPDILLTNYVMLELILTRADDREIVRSAQNLKFLVFDELHTYRGRQGADVALLIRRSRISFNGVNMICVGTSATMSTAGNSDEQKTEVAQLAETLFGTRFDSSQVIGETLQPSTPEMDMSDSSIADAIRRSLESPDAPPNDYEAFKNDPLSSWIESTFGIQSEPESGTLIRQKPRRIKGEGGAAAELAKLTSVSEAVCEQKIKAFLLRGSYLRQDDSSRFPIFAFRLHQFFTRGDTVWSTMEPEQDRYLAMSKQVTKPGDNAKLLFPLVFCRQCGKEYYRVTVLDFDEVRVLKPREDTRDAIDEMGKKGYLYLSTADPWPRNAGPDLLSRLPEDMKETTAQGLDRVRSDREQDLPELINVEPDGAIVSEGQGLDAALIHGNFFYCLNSECKVAYTKLQRSERTKLGTLGVDSRSTATTILALRSLVELQGDKDLQKEARKLLSFTDNRQDASLQAGHFNDFAQIALLRSAVYKATLASETGLTHSNLSSEVFKALPVDFDDYAADPDVRGPARDSTKNSLRKVITYYLYRDLKRDWRVTAPNLEDCGLLNFDYVGLSGEDGLLSETELWETGFTVSEGRDEMRFVEIPDALRLADTETRREIISTLLEVLRRNLSVKTDVLDQQRQFDLVQETNSRLREGTVWFLEDSRELSVSSVAYIGSKPQNPRLRDTTGQYISSYGGFGRYLKRRLLPFIADGVQLGRDDIDHAIEFLFQALKRYGILEQVRSDPSIGFQINPEALIWKTGDGEAKPLDRTRITDFGESVPEPNRYFVECYKTFADLKYSLEAREHTAQVPSEVREEREGRFRTGDLPLMFCSPTMELGVDISQLNVVNMRNVPPTPANYAQRSGRAGRGGQPALVFIYCAGQSPHDQFYYRHPNDMVAGAVAPPRIDLGNRDLIRSHLHAVWMEIAKPDLGKTLTSVLDLSPEDGRITLPVKEGLEAHLRNADYRSQARIHANKLIESIESHLTNAAWYQPEWVKEVYDQLELSFNTACERWRSLYRSAKRQQEIHNAIVLDHSRTPGEREQSKRLRGQAEAQLKLLTEAEGIYQGDFYSYRYFAAEGFLPGYNFPRLPISAFVPARRRRTSRDEFLSRPRFLAISEFGPRALVYHEGARYRVYKVNLDYGAENAEEATSLVSSAIKRCDSCGYAHPDQGLNHSSVCDNCRKVLEANSKIDNLVRLQNVSLRLVQRITCDEEERQRFGYKLVTSYRFPEVGGRLDRRDAEVFVGEDRRAILCYGDSADLYRINLGWARQGDNEPKGFILDLERGIWGSNKADEQDQDDPMSVRKVRIVPHVADSKNALVLKFAFPPDPKEIAGVQAAFKEAILRHFQLEPRELSVEAMPNAKERKEVLFYESSEGGAGVLRQIVDDPAVFPALARKALEICHFDPDTLEDLAMDSCGRACYECLLDYFNQPDHQVLDRYLIRDLLKELSTAECKPAGGTGSRVERMLKLRAKCDSGLEKKWLDLIDELQLRPPSDAQYLIEPCSTKPDFFYREYNAAIYIDGPPHDTPAEIAKDEQINENLFRAGYIALRFHHTDDWEAILRKHPDIFGNPTGSRNEVKETKEVTGGINE